MSSIETVSGKDIVVVNVPESSLTNKPDNQSIKSSASKKSLPRTSGKMSVEAATQSETAPPSQSVKDKLLNKVPTKKEFMTKAKHSKIQNLDYSQRDPNDLHSEIKVNFRDVIAEPDGAHSFNTVWGSSFKTYSVTKYWTYRILTAVLGIPFALFWGVYFAALAFVNVWCVVPFVKGFVIQMKFFSKIWSLLIGTFLDPFFTSIGKIFSAVKVHFTMNRN